MEGPTVPLNPEEEKKKAFYAQYIALCNKFNLQLSIMPRYLKRDENGLSFYVTVMDINIVDLK